MFYYTYKTTNSVNGHYYIGAHKTEDFNDGYIGSGTVLKKAIKKHGKEKFFKEILKFHPSEKEMYAHERAIVNEAFVARPDTYNLKLGGAGGFDYINSTMTTEQRKERALLASSVFQEKLKDPEFYLNWYAKMLG